MRNPSSHHVQLQLLIALVFFIGSSPDANSDFRLPILNPVAKILSVDSDIKPEILKRFEKVDNLRFEIRMIHGNLIPGRLFDELKKRFAKTPKQIVLSGKIRDVHARQIRKLTNTGVKYEIGSGSVDPELINRLYSLGPVHKTIVVASNLEPEQLAKILKMKYTSLQVTTRDQAVSEELIDFLARYRKKTKTFSLSPNATADQLYDLTVIDPLRLEIRTINNNLDEKLLKVLADLRGVELTLVVDGKLTVGDVMKFSHLDRFNLKVELGRASDVIPGLVQLLNRIGPP